MSKSVKPSTLSAYPSAQDWQSKLYNGLVQPQGKSVPIASGSITVPLREMQLSEITTPSLDIVVDNMRNRGLHNRSKNKFAATRSINFMPQE